MHIDQLPGPFFGPDNLIDLLRHRALKQPHKRAFTFLRDGETDEQIWSYADVDTRARAIAAALQEQGLAGERALLLYPAGLEFIAAFFGCMYAGVVAVPAYQPRRNRNMTRIERIAESSDARVALTTRESLDRVRGFIRDTPKLVEIDWLATDELPNALEQKWQLPEVHGGNLALLQYTSGSTGDPKGVMLSHANLIHNSAMISYAFEHTRSGSGVFWLPSYHDMGLIGGILQPIYCGQANVILSPAAFLQRPYRWLRAISHYGASISGGPNFAYDLAVEKISDELLPTLDLSRWTLAFNGAEPIRNDTLTRFTEKFGRCGFRREAFYPCYGLAEATLIVSGGLKTAAPVVRSFDSQALESHEVVEALREEAESCELVGSGGNLIDQRIVIADPETCQPCPDNRVGEVWVAGPSVAQGYWGRPEDTEATFSARLAGSDDGPFLRTGDLGFLSNGELFITGRLKDLIILRGVNHYPQDIEYTVGRAHPQLRQNSGAAFTIGKTDDEQLIVVQETQRVATLDTDGILEAIRSAVSTEHDVAIDTIVLIKAGRIPKTSSGKIQRHACRTAFLEGTLPEIVRSGVEQAVVTPAAPIAAPTPKASEQDEQVLEAVYEEVRKVARERANVLTPDTNIVDLGLDSLERIEIVAALEDRFEGRLPEAVLLEIETCQQVADAIARHIGTSRRVTKPGGPDAEIPPEHYRFDLFPEYTQLRQRFAMLQGTGLKNPYFNVHEGITRDTTVIGGQRYINFTSYNYLGMSGDPVVSEVAKDAIDQFGTSASASRVVSGEKTIHRDLEIALADFLGTEDTVCFVGGHATNETTIGHLFGPGDLILHDELAHNSIIQGCLLSGARRRPFRHNDPEHCNHLLSEYRREYRRVLIVIEGVYSMDGDYPDLQRFVDVKRQHRAFLMVDEAHSFGTMGPTGRGISEFADVDPRQVDLWMGTMSKALGSTGGFISGSRALVEYLKYTAPGFVFSVALPPVCAAAAMASLTLLEEEPERVAQLRANSDMFLQLAKEAGLDTGDSRDTPVIPVILGNSQHAMLLSQRLFERGINVQPIVHPAVEERAARLRFFITSLHHESQIRTVVKTTAKELSRIDARHLNPQRARRGGKSAVNS